MDQSQDQSTSESLSRKIRLKLLLDQAQQLENDLPRQHSKQAFDSIGILIKESDDIINEGDAKDRVEHTTEVLMDTHILKLNHEIVSKIMHQNSEFNELIYQNALDSIVNTGPIPNWDALADVVFSVPRTVNVQSTMLGAIEVALKPRAVKDRTTRKRKSLAPEKRPETVNLLKRQDKGAEKMNFVYKQLGDIFKLNRCRSVPFFKLVIDPHSFMNTIENAFQLSFLARDGQIAVDIGEDGHPEVRLVQGPEQRISIDTSQWICSLDEEKCNEMKNFYKIKEAMLEIPLDEEDEEIVTYEEEYLESD